MPAAVAADIMVAEACAALTSAVVPFMPDVSAADIAWRVAAMDTAQYPDDRLPGVFTAMQPIAAPTEAQPMVWERLR